MLDLNLEDFLKIKIRNPDDSYSKEEIEAEAKAILKDIKSIKGGSPRQMIFRDLKDFFGFRKGFK